MKPASTRQLVILLVLMWVVVLLAAATFDHTSSKVGAMAIAAGATVGALIGHRRRNRQRTVHDLAEPSLRQQRSR